MILKGWAFACHFQTQGQQDAAKIQRQLTDEATQAFDTGEPGLKLAIGDIIKDLGKPGDEPASVKNAFTQIRSQQESQFDQAEGSAPLNVEQVAKSTGYRGAKGAVGEQEKSILFDLENRRKQAARSLKEQETDAALSTRDFEISQLLGLGEGGVSQAFGFGQNAITAAGMNTRNPWGGAVQGATAGAALGTEIYPGIGTAVGALVGGAGGYFAGNAG